MIRFRDLWRPDRQILTEELARIPDHQRLLPIDFDQLHRQARHRNPHDLAITIPWPYIPAFDAWLEQHGGGRVGGTLVHYKIPS